MKLYSAVKKPSSAPENHYKDNPAKLAEWLNACRIDRRRQTEAKTETPPVEEENK